MQINMDDIIYNLAMISVILITSFIITKWLGKKFDNGDKQDKEDV